MLARYGRFIGRPKGYKASDATKTKMAESARIRWAKPEEREKVIKAQNVGKLESESWRRIHSEAMKETLRRRWADPNSKEDFRKSILPKMVAGWKSSPKWKDATKLANSSPEHLEQLQRIRTDPEIQSRRVANMKAAYAGNLNLKFIRSVAFKRMWANPAYRDKKIIQLAHTAKKNTSIELLLQQALLNRSVPFLTGVPIKGIAIADIQLADSKTLIFADGCYWHGCPAHHPEKADRRKADERITNELGLYGWTVFRFWEHEIKANPEKCVERVCKGETIVSLL